MKDWLLPWKLLSFQSLNPIVLALNFLQEMTVSRIQSSWSFWLSGRDLLQLQTKIKSPPPKKKKIKGLDTKTFWHFHTLAEDIHMHILRRNPAWFCHLKCTGNVSFANPYGPFCCNSLCVEVDRISFKKGWEFLCVPTLVYPVGFPQEIEGAYLSFVSLTQGDF